jgi:hypothetical protein
MGLPFEKSLTRLDPPQIVSRGTFQLINKFLLFLFLFHVEQLTRKNQFSTGFYKKYEFFWKKVLIGSKKLFFLKKIVFFDVKTFFGTKNYF